MTFEEWRATVPWTNAEIADALEVRGRELAALGLVATFVLERAKRVRAGHLTNQDVKTASKLLVRTCFICGKAALYISGFEGRCAAHKAVIARTDIERQERFDRRRARTQEFWRERDAYLRKAQSATGAAKFKKRTQ